MRPKTLVLTTMAAAAVLLSACGSGAEPEASSSASATAPTSDTVRLLTYESYAISDETLAAFTTQTGLKVDIIRAGDAGEMVNRALLTKENPEADLLFGIDNNQVSRALDSELFVPYQPAAVDQIPGDAQVNTDGRLTPIDTGDVCLNYDRAAFKDKGLEPPRLLSDLDDAKYKSLLVVENPATSTPGLAFMLATVATYGADGYLDYWQRLKDNDVLVENSWSKAYNNEFSGSAGSDGDRPLVVSYASSPAAEVVFAEKPPKEAPTAAILDTCYQQIEFAGVLSNSENEPGAKMLLDFMLTKTYQDDIPLNNFVYPVMPDATLPEEFLKYAPKPESVIELAPDQVAENRDDWVKEWTNTMQR